MFFKYYETEASAPMTRKAAFDYINERGLLKTQQAIDEFLDMVEENAGTQFRVNPFVAISYWHEWKGN